MDPNVENALWLCGSDRVFKREVSIVPGASPAGVAIRVVSADELARRVEGTAAGSFVRMVKADGSDINEAGDAAATAYASHLRVGRTLEAARSAG